MPAILCTPFLGPSGVVNEVIWSNAVTLSVYPPDSSSNPDWLNPNGVNKPVGRDIPYYVSGLDTALSVSDMRVATSAPPYSFWAGSASLVAVVTPTTDNGAVSLLVHDLPDVVIDFSGGVQSAQLPVGYMRETDSFWYMSRMMILSVYAGSGNLEDLPYQMTMAPATLTSGALEEHYLPMANLVWLNSFDL